MRFCHRMLRNAFSLIVFCALCLAMVNWVRAQISGSEGKSSVDQGVPTPNTPASENPLANQQSAVAEQFKKLEALLLKSAELEAADNPTRAALLQQAAQLGKQTQLSDLLVRAARSLEQKQFSQAIEDQKNSRDSLKRLLELLQSENRQDRIREQKEEVRRWIEETDRLLRLQISQRGRTEGGQENQQAAKDQAKLADKAQDILQGMKGSESPNSESKNDESSKTSPKEANKDKPNSQSDKPIESRQPQGEKRDGDDSENKQQRESKDAAPKAPQASPPGEGNQSQGDKEQTAERSEKEENRAGSKQKQQNSREGEQSPSQGDRKQKNSPEAQPDSAPAQPSPSEPPQGNRIEEPQSQSEKSGQQQNSPQSNTPQDPQQRAKQRIQSAKQKMQDAQEKLEKADREGAVDKQLEAEEQLRAAIEELEEILRQMREEEIERSLAAVDTRLRKMLEMQVKVFEETKRLQAIAGDKVDRQIEIRASNLSLEERKILAESERVQLLLREEGSSVAFPEAIAQMTSDIQSVVDRLAKADIGKMTMAIEQEIITALEEMLAALAQVQKEQQQRQQQQDAQPQQTPSSGEQPLVDKLAELRLIRTLQVRVNKRTNILSEMLQDPGDPVGQAAASDILLQLRELAQRQSSVQRVTRDIVVGKDK